MSVQHISSPLAAVLEKYGVTETYELWFDGACEPRNPGGVATCGWIVKANGEVIQQGYGEVCRGDGATNNVAEYSALGFGLRWMLDNHQRFGGSVVRIFGDSQLVIEQLNDRWRCNKEHLQRLRTRCRAILEELHLASWTATWVPREQNAAADALSRKAYEEATGRAFPERTRR